MSRPLITVAMPVRNCEDTIATAVRSVLNQTFYDWELLVLDDGSTDGTLAEVSRFQDGRIKIVHDNESKGLPARLNEAMELAEGEFYARMDGDDVCYPTRLQLQVEFMQSNKEVDLLGGGMCVFGDNGRILGKRIPPADHSAICRRPFSGFPLAHPTFFGRRKWFQSWRFRLVAGGACDQDLLLRSFAQSRFANITDILIGYREEEVVLKKCFSYRAAFGRSLLDNCKAGSVATTALGLALIAVKLSVDTIAVSTGLQHRILRHRARPMTDVEAGRWRQVWLAANQGQ